MIPADLASRLRLVSQDLPAPVSPPTPARQLTDVLSDLSAGQRIMAEIQALLPNGMYRAVVAQRDVTLALPFSAKAGDTLELEVQENDGKLILAVVANQGGDEVTAKAGESVSTTLSKTGNLIASLLNEVDQQGGRAKPAALNGNQPLIDTFPDKPADLVPILKESLSKSGMFYEAHQARWVEGKLTTASLLQEPQGKFSLPTASAVLASSAPIDGQSPLSAPVPPGPINEASEMKPADTLRTVQANEASATASKPESALSTTQVKTAESLPQTAGPSGSTAPGLDNAAPRTGPAIHPELTPLVQQQLNALATQTYIWQGQVWPGQSMHWEISEQEHKAPSADDEITQRWQTRLKLDLPQLGGIDATLRLGQAGKLELSLIADNAAGQATLQQGGADLDRALQAAGLQLTGFIVSHGEIPR